MEPVTAIAAAKLVELAFNEFIKSRAGEIATVASKTYRNSANNGTVEVEMVGV